MLRLIISGFLLSLLFSCNNKTTDLEKNSVRVTYKDLEPNERILTSAGIDLLEKFSVEIYSDKTFYSVFAAYYTRDNSEVPNVISLIDYQFFAHNAFNQGKVKLIDTIFVHDKMECLLRVDKKANVLLNNDSLYLAVFDDFHVAPIPMGFNNSSMSNEKTIKVFDDSEIIPLCKRDLYQNDKDVFDSKKEFYMLLGLVISDQPSKLDFKKMFDSEKVKFYLPVILYDNHFREENTDLVSRTDSFLISN